MRDYIDLFWTFCRIGGLTFGGGYAMLPMLQKEVVETKAMGDRRRSNGLLCGWTMYARCHRC